MLVICEHFLIFLTPDVVDFWVSSLVKPWRANLSLRTTHGRGRKKEAEPFSRAFQVHLHLSRQNSSYSSYKRSTPGYSQTLRKKAFPQGTSQGNVLSLTHEIVGSVLGECVLTGSGHDSISFCEGEGQSLAVRHSVIWAWPHSAIYKHLVTHPSCHFFNCREPNTSIN